MRKYTLLLIAGSLLSLFSCTKVATVVPPTPVPPSTNVITVSDGSNVFDTYPVCNFTNLISSTMTSVFTINMNINNTSTFNLSLTVYGPDTSDKGKYTAYNSLTDADAFSEFTNDGHGMAYNIYDYIVDSAVVNISSFAAGVNTGTGAVSGTYQLWLQPNRNSLAKNYKTVNGTFNSTGVYTYAQ